MKQTCKKTSFNYGELNAVLAIQFSCCRIKLRCLNSKLLSLNQISYTVPGFVPWTCSVYLQFNSYLNSINTMFHVPCLLFLQSLRYFLSSGSFTAQSLSTQHLSVATVIDNLRHPPLLCTTLSKLHAIYVK